MNQSIAIYEKKKLALEVHFHVGRLESSHPAWKGTFKTNRRNAGIVWGMGGNLCRRLIRTLIWSRFYLPSPHVTDGP
jgi:hypothetical protein